MTKQKSEITTRPVALADLLDGIAEGSVLLPDFQRDFDWNTSEIVSLIATLLRGWPAGSLLLMRGEPEFFRTRSFEYAPSAPRAPDYVILDGQQRLTSCFLALRGYGPRVYALKYDKEMLDGPPQSAEELEERIEVFRRGTWEAEYDFARQAKEKVVPLHALSSASDFFEWRDRIAVAAGVGAGEGVAGELSRLYRDLLGTVNHYDFPSVVLENDFPSEAVARIFERINRSGRRLNTFDLMVARSYSKHWNLRDKWAEATRESELVERFLQDDGLPALELIALQDRLDVRQPSLLSIAPSRVQDAWDEAVASLNSALEALSSLGVVEPDRLPFKAQLLTLGGLAWTENLADHRSLTERWFWGSSLSSAFDVASSTRIVSELKILRAALLSGEQLEVPTVAEEVLVESTRRRTPSLWRAFQAALGRLGAIDPVSGNHLDSSGTKSVVMSLFPKQDSDGMHLRVFGLARVSRETARAARSSSLLSVVLTSDADEETLRTQLLPPLEDLLRMSADPQELIRWRVRELANRLEELLGQPVVGLAQSVT